MKRSRMTYSTLTETALYCGHFFKTDQFDKKDDHMLSEKKIILIAEILKEIPKLACAYLHCSALTEYFRKQSEIDIDIDIVLLFLPDTKASLVYIIKKLS